MESERAYDAYRQCKYLKTKLNFHRNVHKVLKKQYDRTTQSNYIQFEKIDQRLQ